MGGYLPVCPFCGKVKDGLKDHVKAKHPDKYPLWRDSGFPPAWMYDSKGELIQVWQK